MKKITQLLSAFLSVVMVSQFIAVPVYAKKLTNDNKSENSGNTFVYSAVNLGIDYIESTRDEYGVWSTLSDCAAAYVIDTIESLNAFGISENQTAELINTSVKFFKMLSFENINDLSYFLTVNALQNDADIAYLKEAQNPDGGFGLAEGYASDIIDTKLALKALTDIGETEAMTKAATVVVKLFCNTMT